MWVFSFYNITMLSIGFSGSTTIVILTALVSNQSIQQLRDICRQLD
jgi:hypothetical protein